MSLISSTRRINRPRSPNNPAWLDLSLTTERQALKDKFWKPLTILRSVPQPLSESPRRRSSYRTKKLTCASYSTKIRYKPELQRIIWGSTVLKASKLKITSHLPRWTQLCCVVVRLPNRRHPCLTKRTAKLIWMTVWGARKKVQKVRKEALQKEEFKRLLYWRSKILNSQK